MKKKLLFVFLLITIFYSYGFDNKKKQLYEEMINDCVMFWNYNSLIEVKNKLLAENEIDNFDLYYLLTKTGFYLVHIDNENTQLQTTQEIYGNNNSDGFLKTAIESGEKALKQKLKDPELMFYLSYLYNMKVSKTDVTPAAYGDKYKEFLNLNDKDNIWTKKINLFYYLSRDEAYGGNTKRGIEIYDNYILDNPDDIFVILQRAYHHIKKNQFDDAKKYLNDILRINPNHLGAKLRLDTIDVYNNNPILKSIKILSNAGMNNRIINYKLKFLKIGERITYEKIITLKKTFENSIMAGELSFVFNYDRTQNEVDMNLIINNDPGKGYRMIFLQSSYMPSIDVLNRNYTFAFSHINPSLFMYDDTNIAGIGLGCSLMIIGGVYYWLDLKYNALDFFDIGFQTDIFPVPLSEYKDESNGNTAIITKSFINSSLKVGKRFSSGYNIFGKFSILKDYFSHDVGITYQTDNKPEYILPSNDTARWNIGLDSDFNSISYAKNGYFKQGWKSRLFYDYYLPLTHKDWGFENDLHKLSYTTMTWGCSIGAYLVFLDRINWQIDLHYRDGYSLDENTKWTLGKNQPNAFNSDALRVRGFDIGQFQVSRIILLNNNINVIALPTNIFIGFDVDNAIIYDYKNLNDKWHYLIGGSIHAKVFIPKAELTLHIETGIGTDININDKQLKLSNLQIEFYVSRFWMLPF